MIQLELMERKEHKCNHVNELISSTIFYSF